MRRAGTSSDDSARSPFAGCAILIAALLVMVFLIVFSTFTLFRQFKEIAKFTAGKPVALEVSQLENQEAALNALAERIELFRQQLAGDSEATLALSPAEMNLAIAAYEPFKDLRGAFRIVSAEGDTLRIAISFPLNGKPRLTRRDESGWITSDPRFLNGTLVARPALLKREIVLKLDRIDDTGAAVPREFIDQMSPYRITERYLVHPELGPAMAALTRVSIADGRLVLTRVPGELPADAISDAQVDSASSRFFLILGIAASLFLVFAGIVVFLGLRAKASRS
ncbi:MAG: hypothetical protein Q8Q59_09615 [Luteolibacter sp.]|jgi:hypothetical protein|nr:hypothetical protein [Luteolibacter sp.]